MGGIWRMDIYKVLIVIYDSVIAGVVGKIAIYRDAAAFLFVS